MGLNVKGVDASALFLKELHGVEDPERKRKIIGKLFIDVFQSESEQIKNVKWLWQGTIYPDVIESVSVMVHLKLLNRITTWAACLKKCILK